MLTEAELLQYIYQTTEMGRDGIQSVLPHAEDETFHQALEQQLTEYEKLYGATGKMLRIASIALMVFNVLLRSISNPVVTNLYPLCALCSHLQKTSSFIILGMTMASIPV